MINQNKVQLFEEFAAGEVSGTEQNVTPASKTEPASVAVDKTVAEPQGAELRAEIIKDVDSILTNLETLSTRTTSSYRVQKTSRYWYSFV